MYFFLLKQVIILKLFETQLKVKATTGIYFTYYPLINSSYIF